MGLISSFLKLFRPKKIHAPKIVHTFEKVLKIINVDELLFLRVVADDGLVGITDGDTIIIDIKLETMSEIRREFIIAHEIWHIVLKHLDLKMKLYIRYIPGEISEKRLKLADPEIRARMSRLSHECEYEADSCAFLTLIKLGRSRDQIFDLLANEKVPSTETHPSSVNRIKNLKKL